MKTNRGFELQHFNDDYGTDCSIQESSAVEPHVWLGVHYPEISIMAKDVFNISPANLKEQIDLSPTEKDPTVGWWTVTLPKEMHIESRMHLNRKQAKELAKKLNYFAKTGNLKEETDDLLSGEENDK